MNDVRDHSRATGNVFIVHAILATFANDATDECWPATARVAHMARVDARTVQRALTELEQLGHIEIRGGRPRTYRLLPCTTPPLGADVAPLGDTTKTTISRERHSLRETSQDDLAVVSDDTNPEVRLTPSPSVAVVTSGETPRARTRAADLVFEAVADVCGIDWHDLTATARGPLNRAVKELKAVGATPGEVRIRAEHYHAMYPDNALTPPALTKHWPQLKHAPPPRQPRDRGARIDQEMAEFLGDTP